MAKSVSLFTVAAVLLAATVLTKASSYRVTTTVEENDEMMMVNHRKECRQEMQEHRQQLRHCEQLISDPIGGEGQYSGRTIMNQLPPQIQHFYGCCQALQNIRDQQCVCQSLERIARSAAREGSSSRGPGAQFAITSASVLPLYCGLGHICQFQSSYGEV